MSKTKFTFLILACVVLPSLAFASTLGDLLGFGINPQGSTVRINKDVQITGSGNDFTVADDLNVTGDANITGDLSATGTLTANGSIQINDLLLLDSDAVTLTSPTKSFSAATYDGPVVVVTTSVSQTGCTVTGGTLGQIVILVGTSDSATTRWDDNGSTLALGGNITLGVDDVLALQCTNAAGTNWQRLFSADN